MPISLKDTANITTANWGTARNIQIGNTSKSVNGSANVSWSLSEIGAAPAGYGLGTTCQDKSNQDCNNILVTGFYMGSNMTNKPSGCTQGWIYLLVMRHNDSWVRQVAYDFGTASQVYTRVKQNGSWTSWVATDNNTWRGVQDNLTSTATDQSLSANQGKVLKGLIDGKAASNHTHSYLPLSGGTMTGAISSSLNTGTYLEGNKGKALVNSTNAAGGYTALVKSNSTNGYFTQATYQGNHLLQYTAKSTVDTGNNSVTKSATLLNESGNSYFPGTVTAPTFSGALSGNATTASSLASARLIGKASFNGSANITLDAIAGRATIPSSANTHKNKYSKFARIDVSGGTYRCCSGTLHFVPSEGLTFFGELRYYFRTGSAISSVSIDLRWKNLSNTSYANKVFAVKVSDGVYDLYYQPLLDWDTMTVTNVNSVGASCITLTSNQAYVTSIAAAATSSLSSHISNATTANTATTLQTARTINGTSFNGSANITTANWGTARNIQIGKTAKSVNGSANVSWSLSEMGAMGATNENGYWGLTAPDGNTSSWIRTTTSGIIPYQSGGASALGTSSWPFSNAYINTVYGNLSGNASTATKLQTARTINGTSFDGSANITTANWGTARNIQIGNTAKSVNGSANISWSLSEIGAAAASHTHNYAAASHTHNSITNQDTRSVNTTPAQMPLGLSVHLKSNGTDGIDDGGIYHSTLMIKGWQDASGGPFAQMTVTENNNLYFRSGNNDTWKAWKKVSLDGHTHNYAGSSSAGGNANAAVKLATARSINGTNFDGTGNITTANWGTARNIQIGNAVKSVNGSGNVSWNWSEMQVPRAYSSSYSFGGNQNAITTAQFITMLTNLGAFSQPYWIARGSWSYASNQYINDTGCGNIHLAGCTVEVMGTSSAYTIRITTPTTSSSGVTNGDFIYVNNGGNYSPGWRRLYNTAYKPTASEIGAAPSSSTSLKTTDKTIVGAINEVFQSADSARSSLVSAIGSPLASTDTLASIATKLQSKKQELGTAAAKVVNGVSSSTNLNTIVSTLNGYKPYVGRAHTLYVDFNGGKTVYIEPQKTNGSTTMKQGSTWMAMIKDVSAGRDYCVCTNSSYGFPSKTKDANNAVTFSIDSNGEVSISCSTYTSKTYKIMLSSINATYSEIDETEESSYYYVVKTLEEKDEEWGRKDEESNC